MRKYPIPYAVQGDEDYTPEFWNDFREDVDIRIHVIEEFRELVLGDGYLGGLIREARDTLQGVLDPAVQTIQKIQEKGFLVAQSATSVTLAEGAQLGWMISEGDSRDLFTPSTFTILANTAEPTNYAVLRTISYDRDSGTYFAEVVTFNGSAGPHGGWEIGALAGPTLAMLDYLAEVKGARDAVLTATGPIAGHVAAIEQDRQEIATLAGQVNQNRIAAQAAAQAAQTFDPANYYTRTATDTAIANAIEALLDGAPGALNTLNELAAAIGDDASFAASINAALANRYTKGEVDQKISEALATYAPDALSRSGGTMTGPLDMGGQALIVQEVFATRYDHGTVVDTTVNLSLNLGTHHRVAFQNGSLFNWNDVVLNITDRPADTYWELFLFLVNGGGSYVTLTLPADVNWIKGDGTSTTNFSETGVVFGSGGTAVNSLLIWGVGTGYMQGRAA